ncbi:MAG TPA: DUF3047 domain-containing protein [Nitrospirota bacterium]|nr:DUF3047 domain-containing protein [Nitrospirota bacterium]
MKRSGIYILLPIFAFAVIVAAQDRPILFREDFNTLDNWQPYTFPNIKKHSTYVIEKSGDEGLLRAESNASASGIVYKDSFSVTEYPHARWRWKVKNLYAKADPRIKAGDDYPVRIYVMFEYDPAKAGFGDQVLYSLARMRFGENVPFSSLNYVWSSRGTSERIFSSPYTDKAKMVVLRAGPKEIGTWQEETVNILEDYRKAFGTGPPARARIAIMNDSDNTGENSVSWVDYIEVYK